MRQRLAEVAESATDQMLEWRGALQGQDGLTDREIARRYATRHKGRPREIMRFVQRNAPDDADPWDAAIEYERTMEDLLRQHRRNNAT